MPQPPSDRHIRQIRLPQIGEAGQARLAAARVVIVGVGATGSHLAETLGRAGVGFLRLLDRDVVEESNLQRQALFTDDDARAVRPKAEAAAEALRRIDPGLRIEPVVADLIADDADALLGGVELVLDGTDNFGTRFVLNDWCVRAGIPFVYAGVVGVEGQVLSVVPGGPCLRCYVSEPPPPGSLPTCDTAGVLGTAVNLVAALAATEALKLLLGSDPGAVGRVFVVDAWDGAVRHLHLPVEPACPCCQGHRFPFLDEAPAAVATELCGRDAVQLPATGRPVDLDQVAARLGAEGEIAHTAFMVRIDLPDRRVLVFRDGRVIVGGTRDAGQARSIRARLLGE